MKIGQITQINEKGQIVIPKKVREKLGLNQSDYLNIVARDKGFYVYPVEGVIYPSLKEDSYIKILERTQGAWGKETKEETERRNKKRKLELEASQRRKMHGNS